MLGPLRRLVPRFIRRSYVLKFGIVLLTIGLIVGAIGFVATNEIRAQVEGGVNEDLSNLASQEANSFRSWNARNRLVTRALGDSFTAKRTDRNDFLRSQILDDQVTPDGVSAHVVDLGTDRVVFSSEGEGLRGPFDEVDRAWTDQIQSLERPPVETTLVGFIDPEMGAPQLVYATQVQGGSYDNRMLVYLVSVGNYEVGLSGQRGEVVYIVENSGDTSAHEIVYDSRETAFGENYDRLDVLEAARSNAGDTGVTRVEPSFPPGETLNQSVPEEFAGEQYVPSYANVEGTDYTVVVHTPESTAYGFVNTVEQFGFMATIAGVLAIGILGAILGRNTASAIDRLRRKSEEMERGNLDVDFDTKRIDNLGRLYDGMENMRDALRTQIREAREARREAEQARERTEEVNQHLQAKANEYRDTMQAVAAGDLSRRMSPSDRNEAMAEIAEEFNTMIAEIEDTVARLKEFAEEVATSSEEVTASSEEVRSASQKVTESIQEISDGAERQDDNLQSVSAEMNGLSTTVEEIASLSNEVADLSELTADTGRRGRDAAEKAIDGMNRIEEESQVAVEQIQRLDEEMDQIDELIEFIVNVANQTNRLALNANIEASRASSGEGSGGFGAVANEIKDLAAEAKEASEDMEDRVETVQTQADKAVESVTTTGELIEDNTEAVRNAIEALDEIADYAEDTNTGVQEISAATEEQAASTQEVVAMVDEAATISERTSQEAENVAAAAEEQTSAMTQVSDSASELSGKASRLSEALDRFQTQSDGSEIDLQSRATPPEPEATPTVEEGVGAGAGQGGEDLGELGELDDAELGEEIDDVNLDDDVDLDGEIDDVDLDDDGDAEDDEGGLGGTDPATFGDVEDED